MSIQRQIIRLSVAFIFTSATFFTTSSFGQSPAAQADGPNKQVAQAQSSRTTNSAKKPVPKETPSTADLESDVAAVKAENAAVREQLRKMEEQQKALLDMVESLKKKLDTGAAAAAPAQVGPSTTYDAAMPVTAYPPLPTSVAASAVSKQPPEERYQDGIIIVKTSDEAKVPFMLRFNNNTQIRYLNTLNSDTSYTDHLGNVREVHTRNDITVNRSMFIFNGYMWDKRLFYSLTVWTSAGASSIVVAGNIGWQFNKHITLIGGYFGIPGSRSLVNTFPYYTATDRSMADNFFRPGFTQGLTALGEIRKGLYYNVFLGNSLNTLSISAAKIDTNLMGSGSIWWEPLGGYGEPGKSVNMYDDYFAKRQVRVRLGTAFTVSREDRFSNTDVSNPDNTALYNSDGVLTFSTGAFAPGVTVDKATYKMWAIDWGLKYNGFALNGQYYMRWLNNFVADGPLPLTSTFDHGFETSAGYFVVPKKLMVYGRTSQLYGQFNRSWEYGFGAKWHFLPTERLWLNTELMKVNRVPYTGAFTPYTAGMNGWVPMIQTVIAF